MTKKEIVKTISEELGLTQLKTKEIVQKTFDAIVEALVDEGRIELRNFGVFEVKKRASRKARNPRTGQRVDVPEKWVVTFKPGKEMEERVRVLAEARERRREMTRSVLETAFGPTVGQVAVAESSSESVDAALEPKPGTGIAPPESLVNAAVGEVEVPRTDLGASS